MPAFDQAVIGRAVESGMAVVDVTQTVAESGIAKHARLRFTYRMSARMSDEKPSRHVFNPYINHTGQSMRSIRMC